MVQGRKPRMLVVGPTLKQMGGVGMFNEILLASPLRERFELIHLDTTRPQESMDKVATLSPVNFLFFFRQMWRLLVILLTRRPALMHQPITDRVSYFKEGAFMLLARLLGVRVVGHLHGNQFKRLAEHRNGLVRRAVIAILRLPNVMIALSESWRRYLLDLAPGLNVVVVPNTVEADIAALAEAPPHTPGESADAACTILFMGSLGSRKGLFDALKAVPLVREQAPQAHFVFAGGPELGAEREQVEQAQAQAIAAGGVDFPGIVTGQAKLDLFAGADVFLLPSYQENFPISVLEAMAAGLPLVVTPVGALPEVLEEGRNAFFVSPGDVQALANRLVRLARDPALRQAMGAANRELFRRDYAPEVILAKIEALYERVLR